MKEIPFNLERAKAGDPILLNGKPAKFIAHVPEAIPPERLIVLGSNNGIYMLDESGCLPCWRLTMAPKKQVRWVNFYKTISDCGHESREKADNIAREDRIACIRVEFSEGEGLEEVKP